jgi:hypothetical protein
MITEKQLHKQICDYIKLQYPNVLFNTDMSGIKLTIGQATQAKKLRSGNGFPDIVIYETSTYYNGYKHVLNSALFLEVKKETPFLKCGVTLKKNDHLKEQEIMSWELEARGYRFEFVWTFEMAKDIIDNYLSK